MGRRTWNYSVTINNTKYKQYLQMMITMHLGFLVFLLVYAFIEKLNNVISQAIELIEENGNTVENVFPITYTELGSYIFSEEGASLQRFRADVFGYRDVEDLSYNSLCQLRSHIINRMFCCHRNCTKCWVTK